MTPEELSENPFFVLGLTPEATRIEVERTGQKLLAQLTLGVASVKTYRTPFGAAVRDENKVRAALSALRDPEQRVRFELWAAELQSEPPPKAVLPKWLGALRSIGWRGPCPE